MWLLTIGNRRSLAVAPALIKGLVAMRYSSSPLQTRRRHYLIIGFLLLSAFIFALPLVGHALD
ncbi:MAG: hypothetical protein ACPGSC_05505, partial [Granulosicoccaceae bacterium]